MSILDILCYSGAVTIGGGVVIFCVTALVDEAENRLWPRGLRWFPGLWLDTGEVLHRLVLRIFWPEKRYAFKGRRVLRLEGWDSEWRTWCGTSAGGIPEWVPWQHQTGGHWSPRPDPRQLCPCGYGTECAIWCGPGHTGGGCPEHNPELTAVD